MKENMTKTFNFGKIDYYGKGRKINAVTVTVSLAHRGGDTTYDKEGKITGKTPEYEEFTASGDISDYSHGQARGVLVSKFSLQSYTIFRLWSYKCKSI